MSFKEPLEPLIETSGDGLVVYQSEPSSESKEHPSNIVQQAIEEKLSSLSPTSGAPFSINKTGNEALKAKKRGNEPTVHVYLSEQVSLPGDIDTSAKQVSNQPLAFDAPCIGWTEVAERNKLTSNQVIEAQISHWKNVTIIYTAVVLTWLGVCLGGGISWCLVVIGCCSTYYQNTIERYRRAARDDAVRELWVQKLENETETVGWLNNFLDRFWVIYEPGLSATIKGVVDSVLEVSTPPFLESLSLTTFQLGNKAPRIHAVKTYPNTDSDTVLMDWDIEFMPSNDLDMTKRQINNQVNPKVVLQIRVGKGMVGAGMPILVENFALQGTMRVRITFGNQFPHIEIVGLQFLSRPTIDYVLKPVGGESFGFDIAHIPGLSSFIRDQIHAILAPMMYLPNEFLLNVGEIMNPIATDQIAGILRVNIRNARDLKFKDGSGDPYVQVSGSSRFQSVKSCTKNSTTKPDWNEIHSIIIYKSDDHLKFTVLDYNAFRKDSECGVGLLGLSGFEAKPNQPGLTINLQRDLAYVGNLTLDCQFFPALPEPKPDQVEETLAKKSGVLRFTLHQVKELDASKSLIGKFTPYAYVMVNNRELLQTLKKKRNNNPVFEETVDCVITDLSQASISLTIKDDKGMAADPIIAQWSQPATSVLKNPGWFNLNNVQSGKVKVSGKWYPLDIDESQSLVSQTVSSYFGIAQVYLMEAPQLKLTNSRSEIYATLSVGTRYKSRTNVLRGDRIPRWNQAFYIPIASPTETININLFEQSNGESIHIGQVEHSVMKLVYKSNDEYVSKDLLNFWSPLVSRSGRPQGLLHFGSSFYLATPLDVSKPPSSTEVDKAAPGSNQSAAASSQTETIPRSCILTFVTHGAKGLEPGNLSAVVALVGSEKQFVYDTIAKRDTGSPSWEKSGFVFVKDTFKEKLSVVIKDQKSVDIARWELSVADLLKLDDKTKAWVSLGHGIELQFSAKYQTVAYEDEPSINLLLGSGRLTVDIYEAKNLVGVDTSGTSDPFIKAKINNIRVFKTQVVKKNLNPVFNEHFTIPILDVSTSVLIMEVFDWNKINSSEKIGSVSVPLQDLGLEPASDKTYPLEGARKGEIRARIAYAPAALTDEELVLAATHTVGAVSGIKSHGSRRSIDSSQSSVNERAQTFMTTNSVTTIVSADELLDQITSGALSVAARDSTGRAGKLKVTLLGGDRLIAVDRNGTSDPYVKVRNEGKLIFTSKTIPKDCNPTWNESFTVTLADGAPYWLHFSVMDYNRLQSDRNLGDAFINIWDHVNPDDLSTHSVQFWSKGLCGGEPGRIHVELNYTPV